MRFYTLLRRDAWEFSYLPGDGGTALIDPLAQRIEELGGSIQLGASVDRIERSDRAVDRSQPDRFIRCPIDHPGDRCPAHPIDPVRERRAHTRSAEALIFPRSLPTAIVRFWYDVQPKSKIEAGILTRRGDRRQLLLAASPAGSICALEQGHGRQRHRDAHLRPAGIAGKTRQRCCWRTRPTM